MMYRNTTNPHTPTHNPNIPSRSFWLSNIVGLLLCAGLLYWVFPVGGALDHQIITPWVNANGTFPYRENWWLTKIAHNAVKYIIIAVDVILLVKFIGSFYIKKWQPERWIIGYALLAMLISTSMVGLLKAHSSHACPWNLAQQGSTGVIWLEHTLTLGKCFPGGHASAGFSLLALFFAYRLQAPQRAKFYLFTALILGSAMGWAQMMRGAHFLSHNLWTLWVTWLVNVSLYAIFCYGFAFHALRRSPRHAQQCEAVDSVYASSNITVTDKPPKRVD
jgi:membrane-associated PAP2 superfamily phosphatase